MEIVEKKVKDLKPYEKNPRRNDDAVDYVANSIEEFGFKIPIVIDKDNIIVAGHTRLKAAKKLGLKSVPCIVADDLTDEQVKAFRLADNKVSEAAEWDYDLLDEEISDIIDIDMTDFGFDLFADEEDFAEKTQERVENILNLGKASYAGVGKYDIPEIRPVKKLKPIKEWIGFNYVLSDDEPEGKAVHFFIDDYQFERIWNDPDKYVDKLKQYVAVTTPDFSPYGDMPMATQIYNHYRKHWVGRYLQDKGVNIIPTIRASSDVRSLEWYLDGEPKDGIVIISSMWAKKSNELMQAFLNEYNTMFNTLNPVKVFLYGDEVDGLEGNVEHVESFTRKRWSNA